MSCDIGKAAEGWRMSCNVGEVKQRLENELLIYCMGASPGDVSEEPVT